MSLPPSLCSKTLAALYMKQGHEDVAIAVLREVESKKRQRQSEFLTELLARVSMSRSNKAQRSCSDKAASPLR